VRVLFLTTNYPRPESPVDGLFVREHARAAAARADVRVVHLLRESGSRGLAELVPVEDEPPAWRVRYRRFGRPLSYMAFVAGAWRAFGELRRDGFDPDVLHANSYLSALATLGLAARHRKPVVYSEHWSAFLPDNPATLPTGGGLVVRTVLTRADLVLPVSEAMRVALEQRAPRARFRIVPNVVDDELFHPGERPADGPRLLTAGWLGENGAKGVDYLLEALPLLDPVVRLDVAGDGPRREEYERLATRLGLSQRVTFHGFVPKARLAELMRASDLFVLASRFENNPCVVLEAMASGLPVVATRVGGLPELLDAGSGILAEPHSPKSIAARIDEALERLDTFDRDAIARRARERFGREAVANALAEVYAEVAGRTAPGRARMATA
jgi:glycosyltransferase involved in cell wall biosynthesis